MARALMKAAWVALLASGTQAADIHLLQQPSSLSVKADRSVQLGTAQAGARLVSVGERGLVLVSDDNGKTWQQRQTPVSVTLTRVAFVNDQTGWAIGHAGVVLATQDGGNTWVKQLDGQQAAALERDAAQANATANAGDATVQRRLADAQRLVADGADKPLLALHFLDARRGLVVGAFGMGFATADGGQTWQSVMGALGAANGRHLYGIHAQGDNLLLVGEQGLVLQSSNGGNSFSRLPFPGKGSLFGALGNHKGDALLVYGLKGHAYRSTDAGAQWDRIDMPPVSLVAGLRLKDGTMLLADESGQLRRSDDDGLHFVPVPLARTMVLAGLVQARDGALVASGIRGSVRLDLAADAKQNNKKDKP